MKSKIKLPELKKKNKDKEKAPEAGKGESRLKAARPAFLDKIRKGADENTSGGGMVVNFAGGESASAAAAADSSAGFANFGNPESGGFEVSVRNAEPILRSLDGEQKGLWLKETLLESIPSAALVLAVMALFFISAEAPMNILFALSGVVVFIALTLVDARVPGRLKWIIMAVIAGLLAATMIIWHSRVLGGAAMFMDQFYDEAESAQAYIYDRFKISSAAESDPELCMGIASAWFSILFALIGAAIPAGYRKGAATAVAVFAMLSYAYYGLIPSWLCIGIMLAAVIITVARGSLLSVLPLILASVIIFGAVFLIDPGENYGISRMDENFRDRFALRSSYLERDSMDPMEMESMQDQQNQENENNDRNGEGFASQHKGLFALIIFLVILAALAVAALVYWKHLSKRIAANKAGIDSKDPREAIIAMFPYAVRWLKSYGIESGDQSFASLLPMVKAETDQTYTQKFTSMYELWKEAAYSDHEINDEHRLEMDNFVDKTISFVNDRTDFKGKVINKIKYAL